jgi:proline iminopeptidase
MLVLLYPCHILPKGRLDVPERYPEIEPYARGMLDVGDENVLYWEACGNPDGKPALVLHGGPGSGCTAGMRRYFDPAAYRIVLFDQRNCGRSRPHASDPAVSLAANTAQHLVADIELLRAHLGVDRWLVFGGSWGCALALAYAQQHTARVTELILTGAATGRRAEVDLLTRGLGGLFPAAWARYRAGVPPADRDGSPAAAYCRLLADSDPAVRARAATDWCEWEEAMLPTSPHNPRYDDPAFRLCFARIVTHYWSHDHFLDDGVLLAQAGRLGPVPGRIVQGSLDLINLIGTPWLLAAAWPGSELVLIDDAGHGGSDAVSSAIVAATDEFAGLTGGRHG